MQTEKKSAKIYFVRHGQSEWNVANKICGATDIALTANGVEQAKAAGEKIKETGIQIDEIRYSPLIRAARTASEIARIINAPLVLEPRLTEQCFGKYEGMPRDSKDFLAAKSEFVNDFEGGESMLHLAQRIYNLLDDLKQNGGGKNYLLVAHNGIARVIHSYFFNMTNAEYAAYGVKNCQIVEYDL